MSAAHEPWDDERRAVAERLDAAAEAELARLLEEGRDPALERDARARLDELMAARPAARGPRRRALLVALSAAAAAALLLLWRLGHPAPEGTAGTLPLGSGGYELLRPLGAVGEYGTFAWRGELPPGGRFELRVYAAEDAPTAAPVVSAEVETREWTPPKDTELPAAIRWEVRGVGLDREPVGRAEGEASRSPH